MGDTAFEIARNRIVRAGEKRNALRLAWYEALICDPLVNARGAHPVAWLLGDLLGKNEGYAYPTIGYLAARLRRPEITIRKAIRQLEHREWILISRVKGTTNRYVINPFRSSARQASMEKKPRSEEIKVDGGIEREPRSGQVERAILRDRSPRSDGIAVSHLPPSIHSLQASGSQAQPHDDLDEILSAEMVRQGDLQRAIPSLGKCNDRARREGAFVDNTDLTDADTARRVFVAATAPDWQVMEQYAAGAGRRTTQAL